MDQEEINNRLVEAGYIAPPEPSLRQKLEAIAAQEGLQINPKQDYKIELMEEAGRCYCTPDRKCPCTERHSDFSQWGACLCRILVSQEYLDRQNSYDLRPKTPKSKVEMTKDEKEAQKALLKKLGI